MTSSKAHMLKKSNHTPFVRNKGCQKHFCPLSKCLVDTIKKNWVKWLWKDARLETTLHVAVQRDCHWGLKNVGNSHWSREPIMQWGNRQSQSKFKPTNHKGWCQPIGGQHVSYPAYWQQPRVVWHYIPLKQLISKCRNRSSGTHFMKKRMNGRNR